MIRRTPLRRAIVVGLSLVIGAGCATGPAGSGNAPTPGAPSPPGPTPTLDPNRAWVAQATELLPIAVATELIVGENRFLLNLVDRQNEPLASPDRQVELRFYDLPRDVDTPVTTSQGIYMATIPQLPGLYRAPVSFDHDGNWGLEVVATEPDGSTRRGRMVFSVRPTSSTPAIGAPAPASRTPTADSAPEIAAISTDREPDPDFYRLSVDQALAQGRPFLLIFSTPAFCASATCGPALDIVKQVAPDFAGQVDFIHVEPYQLQQIDGQLQPVLVQGQLVPVESVRQWGLLTEPYIFVVDRDGRVAAKLEGVAAADEIGDALSNVAER